MTHEHPHQSHPAIAKRLKRAHGHLASVIQMIEQGRECVDIAQQLQAVESAVAHAKKALIQDHIDHCLEGMVQSEGADQSRSLEEFKQITRYL